MPSNQDLLIEIGTEELPPKSLNKTIRHFREHFEKGLIAAQLEYTSIQAYATPRRLALLIVNLAEKQATQLVEKRGPSLKAAYDKEGNVSKAAQGFLRSVAASSIDALIQQETDKGTWLVFKSEKPGATIQALLPNILDDAINKLPIERKMRWGNKRIEFIRPVQWFVALYGSNVIPMEILGKQSGNQTRGHRFMSEGLIDIANAASYKETLLSKKVIVDFEERKSVISNQLAEIAREEKATIVIDDALLDEVTALVEWPVALLGKFDSEFLAVPEEALISAMKSHQRYFHLIDDNGRLLPMFVTVSNIESTSPDSVISGNERVIAPRLSDARFFFSQDKKTSLEEKLSRLSQVVFQSKLGTYLDKANRVSQLSAYIASSLGEDELVASRAGLLCKADLVSDMVGEFPELQGLMGAYYAAHDNENTGVASAIRDHYKPSASGGELPATLAGQCVSIADKLDTITGLFGIGQPPTGSKDPFALRRQTLGVIRICIENNLDLNIKDVLEKAIELHASDFSAEPVLSYMLERMGTWYQESRISFDTFLAIRKGVIPIHNLNLANTKIEALQEFRKHELADDLISANKRIANILRKIELNTIKPLNSALFVEPIENMLSDVLASAKVKIAQTQDIESQLILLANLQSHIQDYFEKVMVMAEDENLKQNRIAMLHELRLLFLNVADFSVLQD
ncbi:MAG: glycyl-tRNA synthetase beta chain [Flavobacterium sp.]|jgi:glycyl-tRNA synthetase beta chain